MLAAGALLAGAGCGSASDKAGGRAGGAPVVLTLADEPGPHGDVAEWVRTVERLSKGSIRIEVTSLGQKKEIDYDQHRVADVRRGRFDLGKIGARTWDTVGVTAFRALMAPFLVDSLAVERRVLESRIPAAMLERVEPLGLVGIAVLPGQLQQPLGVSRPLVEPADYRGATIAIRPSRVEEATFRALGGTGKPSLPASPISQYDGAELNLAQIDEQRYDREASWLTANVALWPHLMTLVVNRRRFEALAPEQRDVLREAAAAALPAELATFATQRAGAASSLCGRGLVFLIASPAARRRLGLAVRPVYRQLERDPETRSFIRSIDGLARRTVAEPPPRCPAAVRSAARAIHSRLVGSWRATVSRAEFAAAHPPLNDPVEANWGDYTLTFGPDGRFELRNGRFPAQVSALGTYSVRGDRLVCIPGGTFEMGAGEVWSFTWSVYRERLRFERLGEGPSPVAFVVKPWRRSG